MALYPPERIDLGDFTLRRPARSDADQVAAAVRDNLEHLVPFMPWADEKSASAEFQRQRSVTVESEWDTRKAFLYLARGPADAVMGSFSLERRIGPGALEIGYWLAGNATGHGYARRAAAALTAAGLRLDDVSRIEIHCDEANWHSARIPERLGYRLDRIEDAAIVAPGQTGRQMVWIYPAVTPAAPS